MADIILLIPIIIPFVSGILLFVFGRKFSRPGLALSIFATLINIIVASLLFDKNLAFSTPWAFHGIEFSLKLYHFSAFIILAVAGFAFLITLYSSAFLRNKDYANHFYAYLLVSLALTNGAVLADNLVLLLFFWEGLLITLFAMIAVGGKNSFKTATKAFIIVGISDLCMMIGIALTGSLAGTLAISSISLKTGSLASVAFILLMIGALAKGGAMPFHTWIPDAAIDAPLPFMALIPGALEKLLGIYFLTRISLDMFQLDIHSWLSVLLMTIGAVTIILAVMMALVQKDYKKLLSYHAVSQVGYMVLGVGTALPIGIVGGLFHMINNALYKSCLFLTGGAVEKETGTTNLEDLGGLSRKMPITFGCFIIAAAAISGVPPFNGFFSKELIYKGALERGWIFYLAALVGSFFTAASFLKLGHAAFLGKSKEGQKNVKEAPITMLIPMIIIAAICLLFGVYNYLPLGKLIQPILGAKLEGHNFWGFPSDIKLLILTMLVLLGAFINHLFGVRKKLSGIKALDHIRYAPLLNTIYDKAYKRVFDPYEWGIKFSSLVAVISSAIDRMIDWVYDVFSVRLAYSCAGLLTRARSTSYVLYIAWSLGGMLLVFFILMAKG